LTDENRPSLPSRIHAWIVVHLRFLVVPAWIVAAVWAALSLPGMSENRTSGLSTLVPKHSAAVAAEERSIREFHTPALSRVVVVQRAARGLPLREQVDAVSRAVGVTLHRDPRYPAILGAIPLTNTLGLVPSSRERSTTALTYLFLDPRLSIYAQTQEARRFAEREIGRQGHLVGVTGLVPARVEQADRVDGALPWVELATVVLIALVVGLHFRSVGAPLATLAAAGLAFVLVTHLLAWVGQRMGFTIPGEIRPLIVVLLLGIVTDYAIFFLAGMRQRLAEGETSTRAARFSTAEFVPIVLAAGLIVAAAAAALLAATLDFFRALGPALAITVLVGLVVSLTFIPAVIAMFGRYLFWPSVIPKPVQPSDTGGEGAASAPITRQKSGGREAITRTITSRPVAAMIMVVVVAGLAIGAWGVKSMRLEVSLAGELPAGSEAHRAAVAAGRGFAPGIVSPTEVVVSRSGIGRNAGELDRLRQLLERQPGVAGVIGPGTIPAPVPRGVFVSSSGDAARFLMIFDSDPLGPQAIEDLDRIQGRIPVLLQRAGLSGAGTGVAGDTALGSETVARTVSDLGRIALAALAVDLVLLIIFLRAFVAPLYLLVTSALSVLAALGITSWVFQGWLGYEGVTYYVPFAASVLLVALGSDYNVFVVGQIWKEARVRPLRDAIRIAAPRAGRPISVAGLALAGSFALLALVPILPFREFAFAMCVGILIDSLVVRPLLVPALITLFGRASYWPRRAPILESEPVPQEDIATRPPAPVSGLR